jgi:hypothetical protein
MPTQPTLCEDCAAELVQDVADHPTWQWSMHWCGHHGALAIVEASDGEVTKWTLKGPLTQREAVTAVAEGVRTTKARMAQDEAERAMRGTH